MKGHGLRLATGAMGVHLLCCSIARMSEGTWVYPSLVGDQWAPLAAIAGALLVLASAARSGGGRSRGRRSSRSFPDGRDAR